MLLFWDVKRSNWRETMREIIAITQVTLDGVMQAPGGPEEDPRNVVHSRSLGRALLGRWPEPGHWRDYRRWHSGGPPWTQNPD